MGEKEQGMPEGAEARAGGYMKYPGIAEGGGGESARTGGPIKYPGIAEEGGEEGARAGYMKYGGVAGERWKGATGWDEGPDDQDAMEGKSVKGSKSNTSE